MPDPRELLAVARLLAPSDSEAGPSDARLRRAVSTAYYAVFHTVLRAATRHFLGERRESAAFSLLYRSFDHRHMRQGLDDLRSSTLPRRVRNALGRQDVSQALNDFANNFVALQDARHLADYDPSSQFELADAISLIDTAEVTIETFDRIASDEQVDLLAFLMVKSRP